MRRRTAGVREFRVTGGSGDRGAERTRRRTAAQGGQPVSGETHGGAESMAASSGASPSRPAPGAPARAHASRPVARSWRTGSTARTLRLPSAARGRSVRAVTPRSTWLSADGVAVRRADDRSRTAMLDHGPCVGWPGVRVGRSRQRGERGAGGCHVSSAGPLRGQARMSCGSSAGILRTSCGACPRRTPPGPAA